MAKFITAEFLISKISYLIIVSYFFIEFVFNYLFHEHTVTMRGRKMPLKFKKPRKEKRDGHTVGPMTWPCFGFINLLKHPM